MSLFTALKVAFAVVIAVLVLSTMMTGRASGDGLRRCGDAGPVRGFTAKAIRADGVRCKRARRVARQYLRHNDVRGWRCVIRRSGRRRCTRRCLSVSFRVQGSAVPDKRGSRQRTTTE